MSTPINSSFYADPAALSGLKHDAKVQDPKALKEAAKQFESLFTQMMLKSMREANKGFGDDPLFGSDQADFYQSMFDDQIAAQMSKGKGLGLAEMLTRQLQMGSREQGAGTGEDGTGNVVRGSGFGDRVRETGNGKREAGSGLAPNVQPTAYSLQPSGHTSVAASKEDFIRSMRPHAERAARKLGVDPDVLVAQAALETGWGSSVPCNSSGECSFNLFGIKAGSQWSGQTASVPTIEFEEGVAVRKSQRFRAYDSVAASFDDYAKLIGNSNRYQAALGTQDNAAQFAQALQDGGYATDPNYANKIASVVREVKAFTQGERG
ncbi:MAG TPA: flagellar assembly peptidoglycan hydrolase FlgJ [Steroidobacteraceae bacterium]|nr:flagellar assembly peptidoglycan hydrolase FlgJ [Steroidobacteraceae bacterium]